MGRKEKAKKDREKQEKKDRSGNEEKAAAKRERQVQAEKQRTALKKKDLKPKEKVGVSASDVAAIAAAEAAAAAGEDAEAAEKPKKKVFDPDAAPVVVASMADNTGIEIDLTPKEEEWVEPNFADIDLDPGTDELFKPKVKLTKEEKKAERERKKKEREAKKAAKVAAAGGEPVPVPVPVPVSAAADEGGDAAAEGGGKAKKAEITADQISHRTCTGELAMIEDAKDIKVISFSLSFHGQNLIEDTTLELNYGRRYGFIGRNGSGKSTFLEALASGDLALPAHIDRYLLNKEAEPTDRTAMQAVVDFAELEVKRLEAREQELMEEIGPEADELTGIYEKLEKMDPTTFHARAGELLWGLGFKKEMMAKMTKDMSGGWRMRVALARALFIRPTLLLLDEPTNHLDLETCVWLENYLATYPHILLMVSHSQDFLDGTCTNMMHLTPEKKLVTYKGNYSMFVKTKTELEILQEKEYKKQQIEIKDIKRFISSCGTYSNMVKQAQSRQKQLDKMIERGLIQPVSHEFGVSLAFPGCDRLPPPVLAFEDVSFSYAGDKKNCLLKNMEFGIDMDSRIVLVGPNGAGKSTLLKLITGDLTETIGDIKRHSKLNVARYNQHSEEILDGEACPLDWMQAQFPVPKTSPEEWRKKLGRFGVSGKQQVRLIKTLSDGQKTQLVFCWLAQQNPHMMLFDEPTNHLDMESIDSLADAINTFPGGMVLVSHDFRLLEATAKEIWVVEHGGVNRWKGDIASYKKWLIDNFKEYEHKA